MIIKKQINIQAKSEVEASEKIQAMEKMAGYFTAKEWQSIAKKMESKLNQLRIKAFI